MTLKPDLLWTIEDFLAATGGRPVGNMPLGVDGVSIDTRTLDKGDAYFAIKGDQFDGHSFVSKASGNGAALAVVSEHKLVTLGGLTMPLVVVGDVLEAMERLGVAARARTKAQIIAVTGSVGKTTTKEMLRTLLAPCGQVHASIASYNNHWGVPLTLSRMRADTKFGIFEIGMNHPGEIASLVKMVRPHVAVITTVTAAHLGGFKNINEIARAKGEIFSGVETGGAVLLNCDIKQYSLLLKMAKETPIDHILSFGKKSGADYLIKEIIADSEGSQVSAKLKGELAQLSLPVPGIHMVSNLMAAIGAALSAGADIEMVKNAVVQIGAVKGRGEVYHFGDGLQKITIIDESYNANPASMAASLNVLGMYSPISKGRRVAVLGDMLELGKTANKLHKELLAPIREANVERLWLVGNEMRALAVEIGKNNETSALLAGHFDTAELLKDALEDDIRPGDVVMFKSSLGIKFGPLVNAIKQTLANKHASILGLDAKMNEGNN